MPPNVRVQVAARWRTTWISSFKLKDALPRLTCDDVFGGARQERGNSVHPYSYAASSILITRSLIGGV
jgi:hypothetical protein